MAWSAPIAYSVGAILSAAQMNFISDDLKYLHGDSGAFTVNDDLTAASAAGATLTAQGTNNTSFGRFRFLAKRTSGAVVDWRLMCNAVSDAGELVVYDGVAVAERARFDANGNFGIGYSAPQGRLHVGGAGGGWIFVSCNAVDGTLQTPVVAGTVTQSAAFWGYARNNTGGGFAQVSGNMIALGGTFNFPAGLTDTVAVSVTAGGAITVQRTAGTNATHQVNLMVLYK